MQAHTGNFIENVDEFDNKYVTTPIIILNLFLSLTGFSRSALARPRVWILSNVYSCTLHMKHLRMQAMCLIPLKLGVQKHLGVM